MKGLRSILITAFLITLLTACSTGSETPDSKAAFQVAAGTMDYPGGVGLSTLYTFDLEEGSTGDIEVTVSGPEGWNNDKSLTTISSFNRAGDHWSWRNLISDNEGNDLPLVTGVYSFETTVNGVPYSANVSVDAQQILPPPTDIAINATDSRVDVTWKPAEGANSYFLDIFATDGTLKRGVRKGYTNTTTYMFDDISLINGKEYIVGIQALPVDFVEGPVMLPEGAFNSSYMAQNFSLSSSQTSLRPVSLHQPPSSGDQN